jgi:hypothetical protein
MNDEKAKESNDEKELPKEVAQILFRMSDLVLKKEGVMAKVDIDYLWGYFNLSAKSNKTPNLSEKE